MNKALFLEFLKLRLMRGKGLLPRPPELEKPEGEIDIKTLSLYMEKLAEYLWNFWRKYLLQRAVYPRNMMYLLQIKARKDVMKWIRGEISWDELINNLEALITSDQIEYYFIFRIKPEGVFGLPEENTTVIPSRIKEWISPTVDTIAGKLIGYGTLSQYRAEEEKFTLDTEVLGVGIRFNDNFMHIRILSKDWREALDKALKLVKDLIIALTLFYGVPQKKDIKFTASTLFTYEIVAGYDFYGRVIPLPKALYLGTARFYDIEALKTQVKSSLELLELLDDERLRKSLEYFCHAIFLEEQRTKVLRIPGMEFQQLYLLSDIILNLHKAVAVIIGDPSVDKDYQRRYREYGIDYSFWKEKIEELRRIRNAWDVAHYRLDKEALKSLNKKIGDAIDTTRKVIMKYVEYLKNKRRKNSIER